MPLLKHHHSPRLSPNHSKADELRRKVTSLERRLTEDGLNSDLPLNIVTTSEGDASALIPSLSDEIRKLRSENTGLRQELSTKDLQMANGTHPVLGVLFGGGCVVCALLCLFFSFTPPSPSCFVPACAIM